MPPASSFGIHAAIYQTQPAGGPELCVYNWVGSDCISLIISRNKTNNGRGNASLAYYRRTCVSGSAAETTVRMNQSEKISGQEEFVGVVTCLRELKDGGSRIPVCH